MAESDDGSTIAIIGAGIAGLACAQALTDAGHGVTLFDKGRGPGGRASTRRHATALGTLFFDHGAQYFTARDPRFRRPTDDWVAAGVAAPWTGRIVALEAGTTRPVDDDVVRFVGTPGMSALARHLGTELDVRYGVRIMDAQQERTGWQLVAEGGAMHGPFLSLVVAVPAPQAVPLLAAVPALQAQVDSVTMTPCLAAMVAFPKPLAVDFDGAFVAASPLSWAARDSSKPDRASRADCWILHATPEWSQFHHEQPPDTYAQALLEAFGAATGIDLPRPVDCMGHRWGFARTETPLSVDSVYDQTSRVAVCGDWCPGARVEGAYLSGLDAAQRMLDTRPGR